MSLTIDMTEVQLFGNAMIGSHPIMQRELRIANQAIIADGIGIAQENAPVMDGTLRAAIGVIGQVTADGGMFGIENLIYARQREEGGTITAVNAEYLHFKTRDGNWVRVKSVTQTGSFYMARTVKELGPIAMIAWSNAVSRAWDKIGRSS